MVTRALVILILLLSGCTAERGCRFSCEECKKVGFECVGKGDLEKPL